MPKPAVVACSNMLENAEDEEGVLDELRAATATMSREDYRETPSYFLSWTDDACTRTFGESAASKVRIRIEIR